jgi:hypothetical protein
LIHNSSPPAPPKTTIKMTALRLEQPQPFALSFPSHHWKNHEHTKQELNGHDETKNVFLRLWDGKVGSIVAKTG